MSGDLEAIFELVALTNPRLREQGGNIELVPPEDRISGRGTTIIMAAFTHLNPDGSRFSDGTYGVVQARSELVLWVRRWGGEKGCAKLVEWVEENVEETLSVYRLPREHRKRMKSTNMLERLNEEIRRRTRVVRIFPNVASCLRLVRALAVETHEQWVTGKRYLTGRIGLVEDVERDSASLRKAA